jgi:hypothetical protein
MPKPPQRRRAPARRRTPPRRRNGSIGATIAAHPYFALAVTVAAGAALASLMGRHDPRRLARTIGPMLIPLAEQVREQAAPAAWRLFQQNAVPAAQAGWRAAQAAAPSRGWFENQFADLKDADTRQLARR